MRASSIFALDSVLWMAATASCAQSRLDLPKGVLAPFTVDSGKWSNESADYSVVFDQTIHVPDAVWLRIYFDAVELTESSYIRLTSMLDGETQELNRAGLAMWGNSSAYFNGDRLTLELIAAPHTMGNRIVLREIAFESLDENGDGSFRGESDQCGICGPDDRKPSSENWACRLMPAGCSAAIYTTNSCLVTAGHCVRENLVAQFNVPPSFMNCNTANPPIADQYPITSAHWQNDGVGGDWGVLRAGTNNFGQRPFQRYGQLRRISPAPASVGAACALWGYGSDMTCIRSQTQQQGPGTISAQLSGSYQFNADLRSGSSGSPLMSEGRVIAVVTHCQVNCPNHGTRIDQLDFAAAREALCAACIADIDGDGATNLADLLAFLEQFGPAFPDPKFNPANDLNADNVVDLGDLAILLSQFGIICP